MLERSYFVPQKFGMKLSEMGKDMKIKLSVSSLYYKLWQELFLQKRFAWGKIPFYMGTNDQIIQGGVLMVKRF